MRRRLLIFLSIAALASCNKHRDEPVDAMMISVQSLFDAPESSPTRATSTSFESGDQVGLFMVDFVGGVSAPLKTIGNQADNVCFTSNSTGLLTTNPPVLYTKDFTGKTDIYAYYPYDAQMATKDVNNYEFKVQQSQVGGVSASDLCLAKAPDGVLPSPLPVRLEFRHQLSKIKLTLNVPREYKDGLKIKGVTNFTFMGIVNGVKVNMGTQAVANIDASRYVELVPLTAQQGVVTDTENIPYIYHMVAPAQAYPYGQLLISALFEFEVGEAKRFDYVIKDKLFGDNTTKAGMVHRLDFSVDPGLELVFKGSTIEPWKDGPVSDGGLEAAIATEFAVSQQSFTSSFARANRVKVTVDDGTQYDILSGVSVSGGVCKFKFTKASGYPKQYGFRVVGLEFLIGNTTLYKSSLISDYVYNPTSMDLGLLPFGGGGTAGAPYLIRNAADLANISQLGSSEGLTFKQASDIDLAPYLAINYVSGSVAVGGDGSAMAFQANGSRLYPHLGSAGGWDSLPQFNGIYDGGGYAIKGITINKSTIDNQALFGSVGSKGKVYDLKLSRIYIKGKSSVGGVAASNDGQIFATNVLDGVISGDGSVGGVSGRSSGSVFNVSSGATVLGRASDYTGGIVGLASGAGYGSLVNYGKVTGVGYTGGICGSAGGLKYSYSRGGVSGSSAVTSGAIVGGLAGGAGRLDNCYWLSSASYVNCGANGYGSGISAGVVTNFAAMSASDMQNSNKLLPSSLLYKMNSSGNEWVMAVGGHYNALWPIAHPSKYVFAYSNVDVMQEVGGNVSVNIIAPLGVSWSVTSSNAAIATVGVSSGVGSGVLTVNFKDNSLATGGGYRSVNIVVVSSMGRFVLPLRQSNPS